MNKKLQLDYLFCVLVVSFTLVAGCSGSDSTKNSSGSTQARKEHSSEQSGNTLSQAEKWEQVDLPGSPPSMSKELRARGKKLFEGKLGCFSCHGKNGRGNGPAAANLTNTKTGESISPRDFREPERFKWGASRKEIARTILTGGKNPGSPMPPMKGAVEPDELWAVSSYVYSFRNRSEKEKIQ